MLLINPPTGWVRKSGNCEEEILQIYCSQLRSESWRIKISSSTTVSHYDIWLLLKQDLLKIPIKCKFVGFSGEGPIVMSGEHGSGELRWKAMAEMHCKKPITKIRNKYSQKRNCAATVPTSAFMCLWAIYIFPRSICIFCCRKYLDCS